MSGSNGFRPSAPPPAGFGASPDVLDDYLAGNLAGSSTAGDPYRQRSLEPPQYDPRLGGTPASAPRTRVDDSASPHDRAGAARLRAQHAQLRADNEALYGDVRASAAEIARLRAEMDLRDAAAAFRLQQAEAEAGLRLEQARLDGERRAVELERAMLRDQREAVAAAVAAPGAGSPSAGVLQLVLPTDYSALISQALAAACTPAFRRDHQIDDRCTVHTIESVVVSLTDMVAMITGATAYTATLFGALHLSGAKHMKVVPGGEVAQAQAELGFDTEAVSGDEGSDDGVSVVSSVRSARSASASTASVKADIFSGGRSGRDRAWFQTVVRHVGTTGTVARQWTASWYHLDSRLAAVLRTLLAADSVVSGLKHKATTFIGLLELLLRSANHSTTKALTDVFHDCIGRPSSTVAADSSFRAWVLSVQDEIGKRHEALETIQLHPMEFVTKIATKFMPTATFRKQYLVDEFKAALLKAAPTMTMASLQEMVDTVLAECGDEDPAGKFVPSAAAFPDFAPTPVAPAAAAITATPGGGRGKGKGKGGGRQPKSAAGAAGSAQPTSESASPTAQPPAKAPPPSGKGPGKHQRSPCPHGAACSRFGTMDPCEHFHAGEDFAFFKSKLGAAFVHPEQAWRLLALSWQTAAARPAAVVERQEVQSPAPAPPVASSSADPPTVDTVRAHLAKLLAHVGVGDSSETRPAVAAVPMMRCCPASSVLAVEGPAPASESVGGDHSARLASIAALPLSATARSLICAILEAYYAWSCQVPVALGTWRRASEAWRAAYLSSHDGLTPQQVHTRDGLQWRQFLQALHDGLVDSGVPTPVASAVSAACRVHVLLDSGSADSLGDGAGRPRRRCEPHVALTADAGQLVTDEVFAYQFFTRGRHGTVYCISYDNYRHVPGLGRRDKAPFIILSPGELLSRHSIWNNNGLDNCYVRIKYMPVGGDELVYSERIPIDWRTLGGASTFVTIPESEVDMSTVVHIRLEELASFDGRPVRPTACMGIPFSPSAPVVPLPPNSPLTHLSHDSDSDDELVRPLASAIVASAVPLSSGEDAGSGASVPSVRSSASAGAPCVLHFGNFPACSCCSAVVTSPDAVLCGGCMPAGSAAPAVDAAASASARSALADAIPISSSDARVVADIDRATEACEWKGALAVDAGVSRTVQAHWREVAAAQRTAARPSEQDPDDESPALYRGAFMALMGDTAGVSRGGSPRGRASNSPATASSAAPHYHRSRQPARRPPNPNRPPRKVVVLCACPSSPGSGGCIRQVVDGSLYCSHCVSGATCCPCATPASVVPPSAVPVAPLVASVDFVWDVCCGVGLGFTIARLQSHPGLMAFATDILPPDVALANIRQDYPELLPRVVYLQVPAGHLPTRAWLDDAMLRYCGVPATCIIEASVGQPCGSFSTRHGRHPPRNPHRVHSDGQWRPVTLEAAQTDRFRAVLFDTFRSLQATNDVFGCMLENPATSLLWEQPDVHQFIVDVSGQVATIDHCVVGTEPTDLAHGVSNKPSTWVFPAGTRVPDVRCRELSCLHKLPGADFHRLVIQRPQRASAAYLAGQRQVPEGRAAIVPVGLYRILSLQRWCPDAVLRRLEIPCVPPPAVLSSVSASAVPAAAAAARSLPRLTPDACVYTAETLHAVFGHVVTGAHLCDTVNQFRGFRMLRHDGSVVRAPHVTVADVTLSGHCSVCPITQLKDVGSRHGGRRRRSPAASTAAASVPAVSFQLRGQP